MAKKNKYFNRLDMISLNIRHRKFKLAQAAMEFVVTYGWAVLVILIGISALSYFGVLRLDLFLPYHCSLEIIGISCLDFSVENQRATIVLQNSLGKSVTITQVKLATDKITCFNNNSVYMGNNARTTEIIDCDIGSASRKFSGSINISYITESGISHFTSGYLRSAVTENSVPNSTQVSIYDQINSSHEAYADINTARQIMDAVQRYKNDIGFYPPDVGRGNDPGLVKMFPNNPETGENFTLTHTCAISNWQDVVQRRWSGPYLSEWPDRTTWGGEYDYNLWPYVVSRYGLTFPQGLYIGIQGNRSDEAASHIPPNVEADLVARGIDADGGVNSEVQLLLTNNTCANDELDSNSNAVGIWHFDEGSGAIAADSSGKGNNGVIHGASWLAGRKINALSFDGIDNRVEIPDSPSLNMKSQISIIAWVNFYNTTGLTDQMIILNKENIPFEIAIGDKGQYCFKNLTQCPYRYRNYFNWYIGNVAWHENAPDAEWGWKMGAGPIARGSWQHLALTYDGKSVKAYINANLVGNYPVIPQDIQIQSTSAPLWIGARSGYDNSNIADGETQVAGNSNFKGMIDEVKIYNVSLTPDEILNDYTN